jgi:hypothetical protein
MLDLSLFLNYWIFNAYLWVIAGILIIILEFVLSGEGTIILPAGLACFFMALLLTINNSNFMANLKFEHGILHNILLLDNWVNVLYWYSGSTIIITIILRKILIGKNEEDVNDY